MIRAAALGLTFVVIILLTGCGILTTDEAPTDIVRASAPALLPAFPEVEALVPAAARALGSAKARKIAKRAALGIRIPACDDDPLGRGFAVDAHTLVAHRDALPGGGWVRVWTTNRGSKAVGAGSAYRVGRARRCPGRPRTPAAASLGAERCRRCVCGRRRRAQRQAPHAPGRHRGQRQRQGCTARRRRCCASPRRFRRVTPDRCSTPKAGSSERCSASTPGRASGWRSPPPPSAAARPDARSRRSSPATDLRVDSGSFRMVWRTVRSHPEPHERIDYTHP